MYVAESKRQESTQLHLYRQFTKRFSTQLVERVEPRVTNSPASKITFTGVKNSTPGM